MKKFLTICIAFVLMFTKTVAQNTDAKKQEIKSKQEQLQKDSQPKKTLTVGSKEYDEAKSKGLLAHYEFKIVEGKLEPVNTHASNKNASTQSSTLTPCDVPPIQGIQPWSGSPTDDATSGLITLPFTFCFYGNNYTQVRVSTNGNIQFPPTNNTGFTSTGFPTATDKMIAPFWADVDIRGGGRVFYDIYPTYAVFSWDSVGYYSMHGNLRNTFQCVITDGMDPILPPGKNVGFYYGTMQWTTGDASGGSGGFPLTQPGSPAMVGANAGNNTDFFVVGRFGVPGAAYDGPLGNSDGVSWLDNKRFFFNICPPVGGNQEPISTLVGYCDTLKVCGNDTLYVKNTWIAPEATQTVACTASAPTLGSSFSYSVLPNANGTDIYMIVNGSTAPAGYHVVTMTATDNGTPPQTSVQNYVVYINQSAVNNLNGHIVLTPTLGACPGGTVTASLSLTGVPDSYLWSNNQTTASTTFTTVVPADSIVFVTLKSGQCKKTLIDYIRINPTPVASIIGNVVLCSSNPTTVLTASNTLNYAQQSPYTYAWTGSNPVNPSNTMTTTVGQGVYTVTVTNQFGCTGMATTTVTVNESPSYSISTNAVTGGSVYCLNQDTARLAFHYLTSSAPLCGLGISNCMSPGTYTVGTGTTNNTNYVVTPFVSFWQSSRHQYLIRASELTAAGIQPGKLSSLAFNVSSLSTVTNYPNFTIQMKCTSANTVPTAFDNAGLVQVYTTPTTSITSTGWNTFNFPQPYIWDGASNILVDVCHGVVPFTTNGGVVCSTTAFNSVLGYYADGQGSLCGTTNSPTQSTSRPNMRFTNCLSQQSASQFSVTVTPTVGVVIPATKDSIKIDLPSTPSITCYTISVTNPVGGCSKDTVICVNTQAGVTNAVFTANTNTVCAGGSVVLTASGAQSYTMAYIQNGSHVVLTNGTTANITPPQVGLNVYSLTAIGFCGAAPAGYTVGITVLPIANIEIAPMLDVTKCMYSSYTLHAGVGSTTTGNTGAPYTYQWTTVPGNTPAPGATNSPTYTANSNTTQTLVLTVSGGCATGASDTVVVKNFPDNVVASIIDSASVCAASEFTLHSSVTGGVPGYTYNWTLQGNSLGNGSSLSSTSPANQGNYVIILTVSDSCGITKTDDQTINVLPPCNVVIPNVITPNGDGVNDYFVIKNVDKHPNSVLSVFDRWGKKVFESPDYQNNWKADGLSDGTFFYTFDVPDDKTYSGFITVFHGK